MIERGGGEGETAAFNNWGRMRRSKRLWRKKREGRVGGEEEEQVEEDEKDGGIEKEYKKVLREE